MKFKKISIGHYTGKFKTTLNDNSITVFVNISRYNKIWISTIEFNEYNEMLHSDPCTKKQIAITEIEYSLNRGFKIVQGLGICLK